METLEFNVRCIRKQYTDRPLSCGSVPGAFPFLYSETSQRRTGARKWPRHQSQL